MQLHQPAIDAVFRDHEISIGAVCQCLPGCERRQHLLLRPLASSIFSTRPSATSSATYKYLPRNSKPSGRLGRWRWVRRGYSECAPRGPRARASSNVAHRAIGRQREVVHRGNVGQKHAIAPALTGYPAPARFPCRWRGSRTTSPAAAAATPPPPAMPTAPWDRSYRLTALRCGAFRREHQLR